MAGIVQGIVGVEFAAMVKWQVSSFAVDAMSVFRWKTGTMYVGGCLATAATRGLREHLTTVAVCVISTKGHNNIALSNASLKGRPQLNLSVVVRTCLFFINALNRRGVTPERFCHAQR